MRELFSALSISLMITTACGQQGLFGSLPTNRPSRTYDVHHYRIEVRFEEEKKKVLGTTTITLSPLEPRLDSLMLDAANMNVTRVSLAAGKHLAYTNDQKAITVYFDKAYGFADTLKIAVDYSCSPADGLYFIAPDSADPRIHRQIWTQGEDMDNHHWFPCWDYPNDKATSEVIGTVPETWTLLSNGKLVAQQHDKKNRTRTFHWLQSKPHASYLVMLAAGEYTVITDTTSSSIPIEYYAYPDRLEDTRRSLAATPDIMKFFERTIGYPYPWDKYSQIFIDNFMWGGMENTSAVTLNTSFLIDDRGRLDFTADDVNAHEMVHQWFGDLVSFRDWSQLWLSEGFANYFEALYKNHAKGPDEFQNDLMGQASSVIGVERVQGRKPIVSNESFSTNLYSKGAWVLYMLNNILGDEEFFRAIRLYVHRHAFTSVSTYDFMRCVEDATGENLDWFFHQWVFNAGHPKLNVAQEWDEKARVLKLTVRQTQTLDSLTGVFVLPLEIEVTTSQGRRTQSVSLKKQEETLSIPLEERPLMVIVDRGMRTLKSLTFEKSKEENIYQLINATDIADRIVAAKALKEFSSDRTVFDALKQSALSDKFWVVRREATNILGTMSIDGVKETLFEIYRDRKSDVRNAAIVRLEDQKGNDVAEFLRQSLAVDPSYVVQSSSLQALAAVDSSTAVVMARHYVDQESHRDILRRGALNVLRTVRSRESLPYAQKYVQLGYSSDIRAMALGVLRDVGEGDEGTRSLVLKLVNDSDASIRKGVVRVLEQWGGDDAKLALEQRKAVENDEGLRKLIATSLDAMMK